MYYYFAWYDFLRNGRYIKVRKMSILAFHFTFLDQNRLKMRFSNLNALRKGLLMQDLIFRIEAKSIFMSLSFKSTKKNTFLQARSKKACNFLWAKSNLCNLEISCLCTRTTDTQWRLFSPKFQTFGLGQINLGAFFELSDDLW